MPAAFASARRPRVRPSRARTDDRARRVTIVDGAGTRSPEWFAGTAVVVLACAVVLLLGLADLRFVVGVGLIVGALALERLRRTVIERARSGGPQPSV